MFSFFCTEIFSRGIAPNSLEGWETLLRQPKQETRHGLNVSIWTDLLAILHSRIPNVDFTEFARQNLPPWMMVRTTNCCTRKKMRTAIALGSHMGAN